MVKYTMLTWCIKMNNSQLLFEIRKDKELAERNRQELDKQAFAESENLERNDTFTEWSNDLNKETTN